VADDGEVKDGKIDQLNMPSRSFARCPTPEIEISSFYSSEPAYSAQDDFVKAVRSLVRPSAMELLKFLHAIENTWAFGTIEMVRASAISTSGLPDVRARARSHVCRTRARSRDFVVKPLAELRRISVCQCAKLATPKGNTQSDAHRVTACPAISRHKGLIRKHDKRSREGCAGSGRPAAWCSVPTSKRAVWQAGRRGPARVAFVQSLLLRPDMASSACDARFEVALFVRRALLSLRAVIRSVRVKWPNDVVWRRALAACRWKGIQAHLRRHGVKEWRLLGEWRGRQEHRIVAEIARNGMDASRYADGDRLRATRSFGVDDALLQWEREGFAPSPIIQRLRCLGGSSCRNATATAPVASALPWRGRFRLPSGYGAPISSGEPTSVGWAIGIRQPRPATSPS
jgi:7,8-dihydro-6-hydroxymethylpterin-pyrophosphokinase